jgi:HSP20 family protein
MSHTKFNPVQPSDALGKWIDNLFSKTLSDVIGLDYSVSSPSVNITENDSAYMMHLAAPGLSKNDFNIRVENDNLVISSEKKEEKEDSKPGRYTRREFNYGAFRRTFFLDENVNRDGISATYEDGVLKITLPKKEVTMEKKSSHVIDIK